MKRSIKAPKINEKNITLILAELTKHFDYYRNTNKVKLNTTEATTIFARLFLNMVGAHCRTVELQKEVINNFIDYCKDILKKYDSAIKVEVRDDGSKNRQKPKLKVVSKRKDK